MRLGERRTREPGRLVVGARHLLPLKLRATAASTNSWLLISSFTTMNAFSFALESRSRSSDAAFPTAGSFFNSGESEPYALYAAMTSPSVRALDPD